MQSYVALAWLIDHNSSQNSDLDIITNHSKLRILVLMDQPIIRGNLDSNPEFSVLIQVLVDEEFDQVI